MKVFFTLETLANAGTEKSTLDIIQHFSGNTEIKVIYFYKGHDLKEAYERAGIPLVFADLKGDSFLKGISILKKLIRNEKPDIIVSSIYRANIISRIACWLTGTKLIGTFVNDSYGAIRLEELKEKGIGWKFKFVWLLDKWTAFIPKLWLSNASSIALSNSKNLGVPIDKIKVIYRGRDSSKFPAWNVPVVDSTFKFAAIGRLIERKGFGEMIEAFASLKKKHSNISLDIFGEGKFRKNFQQIIDKYQVGDSVKLHGVIPNAWLKLYEANCFVFSSWYEGFSGALIEAMMTGIPIIASNIPMNLEAVTNEKTALIHEVKNTSSLKTKMEMMINSYPAMIEMGKRAREEAFERFDIKTISKQYEGFLNSVVNNKPVL